MRIGSLGPTPLRLPPPTSCASAGPVDTVTLSDPLQTSWPSSSPNQNRYNTEIREGVQARWGTYQPALPELLYKSLIRQESDFDAKAKSPSGHVGLAQLSKTEARREGLVINSKVDERLNARKCAKAGVGVLQEKLDLVLNPERLAHLYPFAAKVVEAYAVYGRPTGDEQKWKLGLAAYNGGQGTVLRTMATAFERGLDPREFSNLIEPRDEPEKSPLYATTLEVFGASKALAKYREVSNYPLQILERAPV